MLLTHVYIIHIENVVLSHHTLFLSLGKNGLVSSRLLILLVTLQPVSLIFES
jgi:hypothetical protein